MSRVPSVETTRQAGYQTITYRNVPWPRIGQKIYLSDASNRQQLNITWVNNTGDEFMAQGPLVSHRFVLVAGLFRIVDMEDQAVEFVPLPWD
jgi:hypothetical protein